jgi:hypothetical protein
MSVCNPHFLSPIYNENGKLSMPNTRIRSFNIGLEGRPHEEWAYRMLSSYTHHWGSFVDPLVNPEGVASIMLEINYTPLWLQRWQFSGTIAVDSGNLIGNNFGGMLTITKKGFLNRT